MSINNQSLESRLLAIAQLLVDPQQGRVIVPPQSNESGYWFGGGNMSVGPEGALYLCGRYRNHGDSRLGTAAGTRGLELAIFRSTDGGGSFQKVVSLSKQDLSQPGREVVSIEGAAMRWDAAGIELFVSTEKAGVGYPAGYEQYLKEGTGVWSIDRIRSKSLEEMQTGRSVETVLASQDLNHLHVKDPFLYETKQGETMLLFCSHPFSWTSSNTGYALRSNSSEGFSEPQFGCFPRGMSWDVAMSRGTALVDLPQVGVLANREVSLLFYDGGECVRNLDEHSNAVSRPRGYSCEELGGVAYMCDENWREKNWSSAIRLSQHAPLFVSPTGTGCSRYVDVLVTPENWYVTWQQSQADLSQPLMLNVVPTEAVVRALQ
ncbi:MAG: hypothetical protein R3C01_08820 [Planctomycetaceae bacterium]